LTVFAFRYPGSSAPKTIATILLFFAVLAYVSLSHESVKLLREQMARQKLMFVEFGLTLDDTAALGVWAENPSTSSFLASEIGCVTRGDFLARKYLLFRPSV
jgi:hypothetical protein